MAACAALALGATACDATTGAGSSAARALEQGVAPASLTASASEGGWFYLLSETFTLGPGEETYLCWSETLSEDLHFDAIEYEHVGVVHHLFVQKATLKEPEGMSECHVPFKPTWLPLFGAANGAADIQYPEGLATTVRAGEQMVMQLHLVNVMPEPVTARASMRFRHSALGADATPVGWQAFGTEQIALPPGEVTTVSSVCEVQEDIRAFGGGPHMHYLGRKAWFEVGPTLDDMALVHERVPFVFDEQTIDVFDVDLKAGDLVRLTCEFDNTTDETVGYGDSSYDEMCYFVLFAEGFEGLKSCVSATEPVGPVGDYPPDPAAGLCEDVTSNPAGVGAACVGGDSSCAPGFMCTSDQIVDGDGVEGFCFQVGCETDADCGGGWATCCTPAEGGGIVNVCLPEACRPGDCAPTRLQDTLE